MTTDRAPARQRPSTRTPEQRADGSFRADIQGLRALAVVSVALSHAGIALFAGGFVGVDIFFVISGYLITQLLLSEVQRTGTISLPAFWARRARRILPAATLVLLVTVFASVRLLGYVESSAVVKDSIWATFFAANIRFGREGVDYFASDNPTSPVQHFWSLAVEEQFYLVWPLVLLLLIVGVSLVVRRRPTGGRHAATGHRISFPLPVGRILVVLVGIGVASFAWSVVSVDHNPAGAYFSTWARAWELAVGGLAALLTPVVAQLGARVREVMAVVGLGCIAFAVMHYTPLTAFPGRAALLPVVGTALVVLGGAGPEPSRAKAVLGWRACQHVGAWSYSFYLWHWPVLIITAQYLRRPLAVHESLLLLVAALGLSALTYRFVEEPFRRTRVLIKRPVRSLLLYPATILAMVLATTTANAAIHRQIATADSRPPIVVQHLASETDRVVPTADSAIIELVRASAAAASAAVPVPGNLDPALLDLDDDIADVGRCDYFNPNRDLCRDGDPAGTKTLVVLGDSHARAWLPAIEPIAERAHYAAYYLVKPGCNATSAPPATGHGLFKECSDWRAWAAGVISDLHPDVLIVSSTAPELVMGPNGATVTDEQAILSSFHFGLAEALEHLEPLVGHLVVIGDAPGLDEGPAVCLSTPGADLGDCAAAPSERWRGLLDAERAVATAGGYQFVDPTRWFCFQRVCPAVVGSMVTYRDTEHITTTYATALSHSLEAALHLPPAAQ